MKGQRGGQGQGYQDRLRHPEFRNSGKLAPSRGGNDDLEPGEKPPKEPQPWSPESLGTWAQSRGGAGQINTGPLPCPTCNEGELGLIPGLGSLPLEKGKATHSSILTWRVPWTL